MRPRTALVGGVVTGLAAAVAVGGWPGPPVGVVAALGMFGLLSRSGSGNLRRDRLRSAADLPFAVDLLVATVRAGAPPDAALAAVGEALGGPLGERFSRVATALRAGVQPAGAWSYLTDVPGSPPLVRAVLRSTDSGAALAATLSRAADDLRAVRASRAEAAVARAATLSVLPLGLCFLPAFLLTGVVPVLAAVLGGALR